MRLRHLLPLTRLSTGEVDRITIEPEVVDNTGGVPLLQTVTATGCAQGGLCAGAKRYVHQAIASSYLVGPDCGVLGWSRKEAVQPL